MVDQESQFEALNKNHDLEGYLKVADTLEKDVEFIATRAAYDED